MYAIVPTVVPGPVRFSSPIPAVALAASVASASQPVPSRRQLGQTEIQNLGVASLRDENVGGLDVAVDDAFSVRRVQSFRNLDRSIQNAFDFHRAPADALLQRHAFQHSMAMKPLARSCFADFIDGANVGMI